ncbi:MAG: cysteine desulfurase [bacterium]|nr:cysteine desulfurase [bacterium]
MGEAIKKPLKQVYLDYAAATPLDKFVLEEMLSVANDYQNPSAIYLAARANRNRLKEFRARVARVVGSLEDEVIFSAGATEANNIAIRGAIGAHGGRAVFSAVEHQAVIKTSPDALICPVNDRGVIDLHNLEQLISDEVSVVSIIYVSNEVGTIQPISKVSEIVKQKKLDRLSRGVKMPLYFHTDASQASACMPLSVNRLGVDMMTLNGAKMYGPKQSGCLYIKSGTVLAPVIFGGGQEFGLRSGTESLMQIAGLTKALEMAAAKQKSARKQLEIVHDMLWKGIDSLAVNAIKLGHPKQSSPHILSVRFPNTDNERLAMELDERGVLVATGSACKASDDEPSKVLLAMGLSREEAGETLRFSFGRQTTEKEISYAIKALADCLR